MIKKTLKITAFSVAIIVGGIWGSSFLFRGTIKEKIQQAINENLQATVQFSDVSLSFFRSFPNVTVTTSDVVVKNRFPFEGDTLFSARNIQLTASLKDLFKSSDEPYHLLGFRLEDAKVFVHFDKQGNTNYDIFTSTAQDSQSSSESSASPSLDIKSYQIENLNFTFKDDSNGITMILDSLYHSGKGDFAIEELDLKTSSKALLTFSKGNMSYLKKVPVEWEAVLGINLKTQTYTFKNNVAKIRKLPLVFEGSLQLKDEAQLYDIAFQTPTSSFDNFLALIPSTYLKTIEGIQTHGTFSVDGKIKGRLTDTTIPTVDVRISSEEASLKYPALPKSIENIAIDAEILNTSGRVQDTHVELRRLGFQIDSDKFEANARITDLTTNPQVSAKVMGKLNLEHLSQAYPVSFDKQMSGVLDLDISTSFDMQTIEKSQYQKIKSEGIMSLSDFAYQGQELPHRFEIRTAQLKFDPQRVEVSDFQAYTGKTDLTFSGEIQDFYGFVFANEKLKGNFQFHSQHFEVNDFLTASDAPKEPAKKTDKADSKQTETSTKIPSFLDCVFSATAQEAVYDKFQLRNVSGELAVKDQMLDLKHFDFQLFGGKVSVEGQVSTQKETPHFNLSMNMDKLNIAQSFSQIQMLEKMAPIAGAVTGNFNSDIRFSGDLGANFMPELKTLSGSLFGSLSEAKIEKNASPLVSALVSQFDGWDISQIDLNAVKANLSFEAGKVSFKPFHLKVADMDVAVSGSHSFENVMDYQLSFQLPVKYLGKEVNALVSKLSPEQQKILRYVPLTATVKGEFKKPKVSTDMTQVTKDVTQQLLKMEAQDLTQKGVKALGNLLGVPSSENTTDSTKVKENPVKETAKKVIEGLFK